MELNNYTNHSVDLRPHAISTNHYYGSPQKLAMHSIELKKRNAESYSCNARKKQR
jgi:hypothetical protein